MPQERDDLECNAAIELTKQRCRIILLLEALERAAVTPIAARRLHGFAYLADVLSPVWGLPPFDGKILKIVDGPHYADLQRELDFLVILGMVNVRNLKYVQRGRSGARIDGQYELRFESSELETVLGALGARKETDPLDPRDRKQHAFLVELAGAMATLPDDEIDVAAMQDATYASSDTAFSNIIDFGEWTNNIQRSNKSFAVSNRFNKFIPKESSLSPGERIYLYASYLGHRIQSAN